MLMIDTHVLVWWVNGSASLSSEAEQLINTTLVNDDEVIVSSITAWEIAMLITKNRLILSMDIASWFDELSKINGLRFVPVDNEIAIKSTLLPGNFHKDPADRLIVTTARKLAIPLVTADEKIIRYEHVKTIF